MTKPVLQAWQKYIRAKVEMTSAFRTFPLGATISSDCWALLQFILNVITWAFTCCTVGQKFHHPVQRASWRSHGILGANTAASLPMLPMLGCRLGILAIELKYKKCKPVRFKHCVCWMRLCDAHFDDISRYVKVSRAAWIVGCGVLSLTLSMG